MNHRSLRLGAFFHHGLALLVLCWCSLLQAQVPQLLNYQGFLTNPGGAPINASVTMTIKLYDASSGGSVLYTEIQPSVSVNNGVFNAVIGSINPLTLPFNAPYWLTVTINADGEMNPRQQVTASAYALRAANADALAKGGTAGQMLTGTGSVPAWSGSPALSGNLTLVTPSTATTGNIMKGANPFIHNFGLLNTFIGENAGNFSMTGHDNTVIGAGALQTNTTGLDNTAIGSAALQLNTIGGFNVAIGFLAMQANTTGGNNVANGLQALEHNTTGSQNTALGTEALQLNTTGNSNVGVGIQAGSLNSTGSRNIAIGSFAGGHLASGSDNIDIGNNGVGGESGVIRIGTVGNQFLAYIQGIYNAPALASGATVFVEPDGRLGTNPSSRRYKDDIADMDAASRAMMQLRPVTFHYKNDRNPAGRTLQYGLVAEEVAEVYPGLVAHSADGQIEAVMYQFLAPMLLNEYQNQQRTIDAQAWAIRSQTTRIAELERDRQVQLARIEALETRESELALLKQQAAQLALLQRQVAQLAADRAQLAAK